MRYVLLALFPAAAIFMQSTLLQPVKVCGALPDLVVVFTAFFGLLNGPVRGGVYGAYSGLLEDIYLGRFLGVNMLAKAFAGYLVGKPWKKVNADSLGVGFLTALLASLIDLCFQGFFMFCLDLYVVHWETAVQRMAWQIGLQAALAVPLYLAYYHSHTWGWLKPAEEEEERLWSRINRLVK